MDSNYPAPGAAPGSQVTWISPISAALGTTPHVAPAPSTPGCVLHVMPASAGLGPVLHMVPTGAACSMHPELAGAEQLPGMPHSTHTPDTCYVLFGCSVICVSHSAYPDHSGTHAASSVDTGVGLGSSSGRAGRGEYPWACWEDDFDTLALT